MARLYTLKPELRKDKANRRGECPIVLVLHMHGVRRRIPLGRYLKPEQWDTSAGMPRRGYAGYATLATTLTTKEQKAKDALDDLLETGTVSVGAAVDTIRAAILPPGATLPAAMVGPDVLEYMQSVFKEANTIAELGAATLKQRKSQIHILSSVLPAGKSFEDITPQQLTGLIDRLRRERAISPQSAKNILRPLKEAFKHAIARGITTSNPFASWEKPKDKRVVRRIPLTLEECARIRKEANDPNHYYASTAAYFLLECYSGLRQSDWSSWQMEKGADGKKYLRLHGTQKTKEPVRLLLNYSPRLSEIVELIGSRFPKYEYTQQAANRALKQIQKAAGIKQALSTHVGRHTAATLLDDAGFSEAEIADVLGISLGTVRIYVTPNRSKANRAFEQRGGI